MKIEQIEEPYGRPTLVRAPQAAQESSEAAAWRKLTEHAVQMAVRDYRVQIERLSEENQKLKNFIKERVADIPSDFATRYNIR